VVNNDLPFDDRDKNDSSRRDRPRRLLFFISQAMIVKAFGPGWCGENC